MKTLLKATLGRTALLAAGLAACAMLFSGPADAQRVRRKRVRVQNKASARTVRKPVRAPARRAPARAAPSRAEAYTLDLRVIEATGRRSGAPRVDGRLRSLARDLGTLPYGSYTLKDQQRTRLTKGSRASIEFRGPSGARRFLQVGARGSQGGKLKFDLAIPEMRFNTRVSLKNGGTLVIGGPRSKKGTLIFVVTARKTR